MTFHLPSSVAVVSATISQWQTLAPDDRLRAAALVLRRDFGITNTQLRLHATALPNQADRVLIAYTTAPSGTDDRCDLSWTKHVATGDLIWLRNSNNDEQLVFSNQGVSRIEPWQPGTPAPSTLVAQIAQAASVKPRVNVWTIDGDAAPIDEKTLELWQASLGAHFAPLNNALPPDVKILQRVPVADVARAATSLDRALRVAACIALTGAALAGWHFALATHPPHAPLRQSTLGAGQAGHTWARALAAAPQLDEFAKTASYGTNAWIITAPVIAVTDLAQIETALNTNGFATQIVREPELRIRIQLR